MYQTYFKNPRAKRIMDLLKIHPTEIHLLWLVDVMLHASLPFKWARAYQDEEFFISPHGKTQQLHPSLRYYQVLAERIRLSAAPLEPGSVVSRFTFQPPAVVIDIFNMLFYLNQDPSLGKEFAAMLALSAPLSKELELEGEVFVNRVTRESSEFDSDFKLFYDLAQNEVLQAGDALIPKLTPREARLLPKDKILVYDFAELKTRILSRNELFALKRIKMPYFELDWKQRENIFLGMEKANGIVFDGEAAQYKVVKARPYLMKDTVKLDLFEEVLNQDSNLVPISKQLLSTGQDFQVTKGSRNLHQSKFSEMEPLSSCP